MLAMFPKTTAMLFTTGIVIAWLTDILVRRWKIATCQDCDVPQFHPAGDGFAHSVKEHIWQHVIKRHL